MYGSYLASFTIELNSPFYAYNACQKWHQLDIINHLTDSIYDSMV